MKLDDKEVHPMRQVFWASIIQLVVVCTYARLYGNNRTHSKMRVAITGATGLAAAIAGALQDHTISTTLVSRTLRWTVIHGWGFKYDNPNHVAVLINHALTEDFDQTETIDAKLTRHGRT